jgi:nuclear transport factor 2 (NTF2) superfamily protein
MGDRAPAAASPHAVRRASARRKVQAAEDAWNTAIHASPQPTPDSQWRKPLQFINGRDEIVAFLTRKWQRRRSYVLRRASMGIHRRPNRRAVQYEWHDDSGQWWRSHGNENWEFDT